MITIEQKKQLQIDAGIPHLPTDLTYECRIAIAGEGERAYDWSDKPHRLVYDLSRQVEADAIRIEELVKERDTAREYAGEVRIREKVAEDARIEAEAKLANCEKYGDAYAECDRIGTQAVRDLEDKLAKAVEMLQSFVDLAQHGRFVLRELEGEE